MNPIVVILTWCGDIDALYGSLLTFKTLRVGFPDNDVLVVDNGSVPDALHPLAKAAQNVGASFVARQAVPHWHFLREQIAGFKRAVVFADPDLVFWDRMQLPDVMAGRLIPEFVDEYTGCRTKARLHTSLWSVPDPQELNARMADIEMRYWESNMLRPVMVPGKPWTRYDTSATLYAAIGGRAFVDELDCYDHLFCGSHLKSVLPHMLDADEMNESHELARSGNIQGLRGIWRRQQRYFEARE